MRYTDPDGRSDYFTNWLLDWFSNNSMPPSQTDFFDVTMSYCEQQFSYGMEMVQNKLSSVMEKTMNVAGDVIVAGAEFMSDYGGVIAIACYASGNIALGMIVDGVSIACDISLTANKFYNKEISGKEAMFDVACTVTSSAVGSKGGASFEKAAKRILLDPKTTEIVSNCISDFLEQSLTTVVEIQTE